MVWWLVKWITWRKSEVCVQPWCNPLWLTGLKTSANLLSSFFRNPLQTLSELLWNIHTIPDLQPWITNCLGQWSERIFRFYWLTHPFNWFGEKVWNNSVQHFPNSFRRGKAWQRPCIELQYVKKVVNCVVRQIIFLLQPTIKKRRVTWIVNY